MSRTISHGVNFFFLTFCELSRYNAAIMRETNIERPTEVPAMTSTHEEVGPAGGMDVVTQTPPAKVFRLFKRTKRRTRAGEGMKARAFLNKLDRGLV